MAENWRIRPCSVLLNPIVVQAYLQETTSPSDPDEGRKNSVVQKVILNPKSTLIVEHCKKLSPVGQIEDSEKRNNLVCKKGVEPVKIKNVCHSEHDVQVSEKSKARTVQTEISRVSPRKSNVNTECEVLTNIEKIPKCKRTGKNHSRVVKMKQANEEISNDINDNKNENNLDAKSVENANNEILITSVQKGAVKRKIQNKTKDKEAKKVITDDIGEANIIHVCMEHNYALITSSEKDTVRKIPTTNKSSVNAKPKISIEKRKESLKSHIQLNQYNSTEMEFSTKLEAKTSVSDGQYSTNKDKCLNNTYPSSACITAAEPSPAAVNIKLSEPGETCSLESIVSNNSEVSHGRGNSRPNSSMSAYEIEIHEVAHELETYFNNSNVDIDTENLSKCTLNSNNKDLGSKISENSNDVDSICDSMDSDRLVGLEVGDLMYDSDTVSVHSNCKSVDESSLIGESSYTSTQAGSVIELAIASHASKKLNTIDVESISDLISTQNVSVSNESSNASSKNKIYKFEGVHELLKFLNTSKGMSTIENLESNNDEQVITSRINENEPRMQFNTSQSLNSENATNVNLNAEAPDLTKSERNVCILKKSSNKSNSETDRSMSNQFLIQKCLKCKAFFSSVDRLKKHECCFNQLSTGDFDVNNPDADDKEKNLINASQICRSNINNEISVYECKFCSVKFLFSDLLVDHYKCKHTIAKETIGKIMFACQICSRNFKTNHLLEDHFQNEHKDQCTSVNYFPVKCSKCNFIVKSKNELETHIMNHSEISDPCYLCGNIFAGNKELNTHFRQKHHICIVCNKIYKNAEGLFRHEKLHKLGFIYFIKCHFCNEEFHNAKILKTHSQQTHNKEIDISKCIKVIKNIVEDSNCIFCFFTCSKNKYLLEHMYSKHNICVLCSEIFKNISDLRAHEEHHKTETLFIYECPVCLSIFGQSYELYRHCKEIHKEIIKPSDYEKIIEPKNCGNIIDIVLAVKTETSVESVEVCLYCDRVCRNKETLRQHLNLLHQVSN